MENYSEYIDAYFNQTLNPEEAGKFELRIREDKGFAEEVVFYLSAKQALKEEVTMEKRDRFRQLLSQNSSLTNISRQSQVRKMRVYRVAAAAAVIVCVFFAWYLFFSNSATPQQMADGYINENLKTLPVKMGTEEDSIQTGLRLYNASKYDSAIQQFETIIQKDTGNYLAKEYLGIVYLESGNYDKAILYFRQLENYSRFSNPAIFYQALTLMKRNQPGDKQKARQLLQQVDENNLEDKTTAHEWLKKW
ncbi:MAG: tol-pal system YbgF family protein [Chitinophagales bacterium]